MNIDAIGVLTRARRAAILTTTGSLSVPSRDGRTLGVSLAGPTDGHPVFLLHGMPGSRTGPRPSDSTLRRHGVRLISYDRPGYGLSTRQSGRTVADAARDVRAIADTLEINRFAVAGRSGGAPHALACAALLPERVTRTLVLAGLAHPGASDLDWFQGMNESNALRLAAANTDEEAFALDIAGKADSTRLDPATLLATLEPDMAEADRNTVKDTDIRRQLLTAYQEAVRPGPHGWIDDALALRHDWGFDLAQIRIPVMVWHGDKDTFAPVHHARWLTNQLPYGELVEQRQVGHFAALTVLGDLLGWLTRDEPRPTVVV